MAVRGKRCSCSISCSARASCSAVAGRADGSLAIARESSRSSETGTSARPVAGTGVERIRGMSAYAVLSPPGTSNGERPTSSCHSVAASE